MGSGMATRPLRRTWTVEICPLPGGTVLACAQCGVVPVGPGSAAARRAALAHLAGHARCEPLAPHLRTCRCGQRGCQWHPRHRGCDGLILLVVARTDSGRTWRLADLCQACTAATGHAAAVPESDSRRTTAPCDALLPHGLAPASPALQHDGTEEASLWRPEENYLWWNGSAYND